MTLLTAIRIILYFSTAITMIQLETLTGFLAGLFLLGLATMIGVFDYKTQVYSTKPTVYQNDVRREGMWCRMCGGACDLENCGMEQP